MLKKVILSRSGEQTRDAKIVGDTVKYRIHYEDVATIAADLVITDHLDAGLANVRTLDRGVYDPETHTVTWHVEVPSPSPEQLRPQFVEFEAVINRAGMILNEAVGSGIPQRLESNTVEVLASDPPSLGWIPFTQDAEPGKLPRVYMKDETTMGTTVRIDVPGVFVYEDRVDGEAYQHFALPGRAALTDVGKPELPVVGEAVEVPFGVTFTPEITMVEDVVLEGYNVYPVQPPPIAETRDEGFVLDIATYTTDANYPRALAIAAEADVGVIRGHRILLLKVNPIQYNPVTRQVTAHPVIEVRLNYDHPAQIKGIDRRIMSPAFEDLLRGTLLNYKEQERFFAAAGPGHGGEHVGCDYLIITADGYYNENDPSNPLVRFSDWKRRKGYRTKVVKVSSISGGNTEAAIKAYIRDAYDHWDPAPIYVLFVGDSDQVRSHTGVVHPEAKMYNQPPINTDLPYTLLDGTLADGTDDDFPDIFLGRLSVDTVAQLADVVDKILLYEQNPPATPVHGDFYTDASLIALCQDTYGKKTTPNGRESFPWIATAESIRQFLTAQNNNVERIYATNSGFPPASPTTPSPNQFQDGTPLPNDLLVPNYGWNGGRTEISNAFNAGRFLISYFAHGAPDAWDHPAFDVGDVAALNQNDLTPVVFSITCQTGWFDNEIDDDTQGGRSADSFAEALLRQPRAGAVAVVAQSRASYVNWNAFIQLGLFKAIWPSFVPAPHWTLPKVPSVTPPRLLRMGQISNYGKMFMAKAYSSSDKRKFEFQTGHLFGDPEMPIWSVAPHTLKVSHPAGIGGKGLHEFVVEVTDDGSGQGVLNATVVLTQGKAILQVAQTQADGLARFAVTDAGGVDLDVTVTALLYRPYMGVIASRADGAVFDQINPDDGPEGQTIQLAGVGFAPNEKVDLHFGDQLQTTVETDAAGTFGHGAAPTHLAAPMGHRHGLVNVWAHGQTSDRFAVRIFQLRDKNPVDLWTYDQWDPSTWTAHPGDNPTWNSPDVELYDPQGQPVASDNLQVNQMYDVKVKVRNTAAFAAKQATVTYRWRNYGTGGTFELFHPQPTTTVDLPANPPGEAQTVNTFTPPGTGHLCIKVQIEHPEDTGHKNNEGQENLHVGYSSSPTRVCFQVANPSREAAPVHLEVRQLIPPGQEEEHRLWGTWIQHPVPQVLQPGERAQACVIIDPDPADVRSGTTEEFAVTAFIGGVMVGGVNAIMTKK